MTNDYVSLSTRAGFNKSLGHFRMVTNIVQLVEKGENLADVIDGLERDRAVDKAQIAPIMNALVIDRMGYSTLSFNQPEDVSEFGGIQEAVEKWNRFDIIVAYHHPQVGISLINPKQISQWESVQEVNREELVVLYIKGRRDQDRNIEGAALEALRDLIMGQPVDDLTGFHDPAFKAVPVEPKKPAGPPAGTAPRAAVPQAAAPRPSGPPMGSAPRPAGPPMGSAPRPAGPPMGTAPRGVSAPAAKPATGGPAAGKAPTAQPKKGEAPEAGGKKRVTPRYSIQVTNELFHNGNVEAWKNIVESYKEKFPGLEVHIFHDGQKVNNINALFKWGKVKNGDVILFSVAGEEIKGVAKLQRYLYEGASLRFENYLKKDVNKILNLF